MKKLLLSIGIMAGVMACSSDDSPSYQLYNGSLIGSWRTIVYEVDGESYDTSDCDNPPPNSPMWTFIFSEDGSVKCPPSCDLDSEIYERGTYTFDNGILFIDFQAGISMKFRVKDLGTETVKLDCYWDSEGGDEGYGDFTVVHQ